MIHVKENTIGQCLDYILNDTQELDDCPKWPPDLFAVAAYLLEKSGAYYRVVTLESGNQKNILESNWPIKIKKIGKEWREYLNGVSGSSFPKEIQNWWKDLITHSNMELAQIEETNSLCRSVVGLCCAADEASVGVGVNWPLDGAPKHDKFLNEAMRILISRQLLSLCLEIDPIKCRVLPKQHTPQCGLTLRSMSHHLSLSTSTNVQAKWIKPRGDSYLQFEPLNLLLFPWPQEISRAHFDAIHSGNNKLATLAKKYGFFSYQRPSRDPGRKGVGSAIYNREYMRPVSENPFSMTMGAGN